MVVITKSVCVCVCIYIYIYIYIYIWHLGAGIKFLDSGKSLAYTMIVMLWLKQICLGFHMVCRDNYSINNWYKIKISGIDQYKFGHEFGPLFP